MRSHARDPAFKELFTMKKILSAAMAVLLMLFPAACSRPEGQAPVDTEEPVTIPPITIPDEPDDRVFTDTTPYAERLESLFASNPVAPAEDFTYEVTDDGVTVTAYTGGDIVVVIPDTIEDKPVTAIGEKAFADMTGIKAVSVPDTVVSHQRVTLVQIFDYIAEMTVRQLTTLTVDDQQARAVALGGGMLCDLLLGQIIIKIGTQQVCCGFFVYNYIFTHKNGIFPSPRQNTRSFVAAVE